MRTTALEQTQPNKNLSPIQHSSSALDPFRVVLVRPEHVSNHTAAMHTDKANFPSNMFQELEDLSLFPISYK